MPTAPPPAKPSEAPEPVKTRAEAARVEQPAKPAADTTPIEKIAGAAKGNSRFWDNIGAKDAKAPAKPGDKTADKSVDKKVEPKPDEKAADAPAAGDKPGDKPKVKPVKKAVDPVAAARETAAIQGEAIGKAVVAGLAAREAKPVVSEPTAAELEKALPDEHRRHAGVYRSMEEMFPTKYPDLRKKLVEFSKTETDYIAKWESEHPGQSFNGDSNDHDDFYAQHAPVFDEQDFKAAERGLIVNEATSKAEAKAEKRVSQIEQRLNQQTAQPKISQAISSLTKGILESMDPELVKLMASPEELSTLPQKDEEAAGILIGIVQRDRPVIEANIAYHDGAVEFNAKDPAHARLAQVALDVEQLMAAQTEEAQVDQQGRAFATREDYAQMPPAERVKHWIVGKDEIEVFILTEAKREARAAREDLQKRHEAYAKRMGWATPNVSKDLQTGKTAQPDKVVEPPVNPAAAAVAPSMSSGATVGRSDDKSVSGQKSGAARFWSGFGLK